MSHQKECKCSVCNAAKELGYRNVSPFSEQPLFVRPDVTDEDLKKENFRMWKDEHGYVHISWGEPKKRKRKVKK